MSELAIEIKDLSIRYKGLQKFSLRRAQRLEKKNTGFPALRGVSFSVERGKIVGIIGRNGGGKSTLLRAIAGIFSPDTGEVNTFGNTVSLLAIGVGFQGNLSGRENIFLSGLLLGFSKQHIRSKMQEIMRFAELGSFIDKPVNTYSSGMYSKLAFSITAVMEADIMLIDEVLSVGDAAFQKKSYDKMHSLITNENRTVLIVSHALSTIRELCDEVIWLDNGRIKQIGPPEEVIAAYEETV